MIPVDAPCRRWHFLSMSKMRKCRACGEDVAKTASNCPKCGAATWDSVILHAVQFAAVLIGGAYLYYVIFG